MEKNIVHVDGDLEALIPGFMENRREEIIQLKKLLGSDDFEAIKGLGHAIKGTGGGYGFDLVTELGLKIEEAAVAKDKDRVEELINELEEHIENVEIVYE